MPADKTNIRAFPGVLIGREAVGRGWRNADPEQMLEVLNARWRAMEQLGARIDEMGREIKALRGDLERARRRRWWQR